MKRGHGKIYFIMLFVLVSLSFFLNFNGLQEITSSVTQENDPCVVDIISNGVNIGYAYVYKDSNGIVRAKQATPSHPFPAEFYPDSIYEGPRQSDDVYDVITRQGERGTITFSFTTGAGKVYCSDSGRALERDDGQSVEENANENEGQPNIPNAESIFASDCADPCHTYRTIEDCEGALFGRIRYCIAITEDVGFPGCTPTSKRLVECIENENAQVPICPLTECKDRVDNDGDLMIDFNSDRPDPHCESPEDDSERLDCEDDQLHCSGAMPGAHSFSEWCCSKIQNNFLRRCGQVPGQCEYAWVHIWREIEIENLGIIRWLDLNLGVPQECDCSNSVLVIFGEAGLSKLLNYQIFIYNQIRNENGPCTFAVYVSDSDEMDDVVYNPETRINNAGKFKKIVVIAHGDSRGVAIDTGGSFGSLVCDEGYATLVSCQVGRRQIFGLPRIVENYCTTALPGSKIKVSRSNVEVIWAPHLKFGDRPETAFDAENLVCTIEDPVCYECTGQNPPTARTVSCDEGGFLTFPSLLQ